MEKVLPKGWVKTKLFDAVISVSTNVKKYDGLKKYYSTGSISHEIKEEGEYDFISKPSRANREVIENDILQARMKNTNKALLIEKKYEKALFSTGFLQLRPLKNTILSKYIFYYLNSSIFLNQRDELSTGATQQSINDANAGKLDFPLPPLAEQERIVAKLDALFAQQKKMKAALARIPQLLKDFRQQVLTQAVTGKLTEQWREGKDLEEWREYTIKDISDTRLGKMLDKAKNSGNEYPYLGNIDVQWNRINTDNLKKIKIDDIEFEKFKLEKGDILVCEGGEAGRAAIWEKENTNIIFQKALHRVRLYSEFLPEILLYNLELDTKSGKIANLYTGTTIKHLTGQNFAKYVVKYCSIKEQQEIVRRVESLFAKADAIEASYELLKKKLDILPQAILHKAFKGDLVRQLPTDGDAKDLLAEIMALKKDIKTKKK